MHTKYLRKGEYEKMTFCHLSKKSHNISLDQLTRHIRVRIWKFEHIRKMTCGKDMIDFN